MMRRRQAGSTGQTTTPLAWQYVRMRALAPALVGLVALSACQVGPDYAPPAAEVGAGYASQPLPPKTAAAEAAGGQAQSLVQAGDIAGRWWTLYGSPDLDALMDQALAANPDLKAAQAALRAAREADYAQRGARLPTVGVDYSVARQKVATVNASPLSSNVDFFTLHTAQLSIGYAPDVFGGLRRQAESTQAQAEVQRFQTEAAYLTLTANVVAAAVQQAAVADQIDETRAIIALNRKSLDLIREQNRLGQVGRQDVVAQEAMVAQAEQALPPLEKQLAQQKDLITALAGRLPTAQAAGPNSLTALTLPSELPVTLPSKLVEQRPDIRAAAANLHVASAQVGVAIAARLPSFPISAVAGGQSTDLASLFSRGDSFWGLAATVAQPIYQGGQLLHRQRGAEATWDQAKAQYQSTVVAAFQNVADVLQAITADARAMQSAAMADQKAAETLKLAQQQYAAGEVGQLTVLSAEQARRQAGVTLIQARAARYIDTAALFQALGGGWWNRSDTVGQDQTSAAAAASGR